jgi:hypothetical protein
MEYPSSDEHEATDIVVPIIEPQFFAPTLDERLRSDEAFLKQAMEKLEHRRSEADQIHRAYDEHERLAALEATRHQTAQQTLQRDEKGQKLLAEIGTLRNAEAEQRQRIQAASATSRWRSAEENPPGTEMEWAVDSHTVEEEEVQLAQLETLRVAAEAEAEVRATESQRLNAEIKALGEVASKQIDRMDEAKSRLHLLEQVRAHAEKMVYERAEREIRLLAEIEALQRAEAAQNERIQEAEAEAERLTEEQARLQEAVEAHRKARVEARQRAAAEAHQQLENETRLLAEEEEQRLEHLESIRAKAEAASRQRDERESLVNSQLLAFSEAAAEQLKRIEKAEADLAEVELSLRQLEARAEQSNELVATRLAETEERRKAAEEEWARNEKEAQALAEKEAERLAEIELMRAEAKAEAEKRAELELKLNADLDSLADAEAAQRERIEEARAQARRLFEEEIRLSRIAEQEEERIVELESLRNQIETRVEHGREEEQQLLSAIEDLNQIVTDQFNRVADAKATLQAHEEKLQETETGISQNEADGKNVLVPDHADQTPALSDELQLEIYNPETTATWSIAANGAQGFPEKVELVSQQPSVSSVVNAPGAAAAPALSADDNAWMESSFSEGSLEVAIEQMPATSLVERLRSDDQVERANAFKELSRLDERDAFNLITALFDDASEAIRNSAARALYNLNASRAETFTRALREAPPERRRQIIKALDCSGLAAEAIESLAGESREKTYDAFSVLFLMAKAGEVHTLLHAVEKHSNSAVRLSVVKLLTFSNRPDIIPALRSLAVRGALPIEVRSALMESIYEISSNARERALSAA